MTEVTAVSVEFRSIFDSPCDASGAEVPTAAMTYSTYLTIKKLLTAGMIRYGERATPAATGIRYSRWKCIRTGIAKRTIASFAENLRNSR